MTKTVLLLSGLWAIQSAIAGTLDFTVFAAAPNPVGISYYQPGNQLLVSEHYPNGLPFNFYAFNFDGTSAQYSNASNLIDEVHLAAVQPGNPGGFVTGDIYSTGNSGLDKVASGGGTVTVPWTTLPGVSGQIRGNPAFDDTGIYSGDMFVATTGGQIYQVTSGGSATLFKLLPTYLDSVLVVPDDPIYGPLAGKILAGGDSSTTLYALNADGSYTTYDFKVGIEGLNLIPADEDFYAVNFSGQNIVKADASDFVGFENSILLTNEQSGFYRLYFNGTAVVLDAFTLGVGSPAISDIEGTTFAPNGSVPEPGTFVLLAAGLCGLAVRHARRSRRSSSMTWRGQRAPA